MIELSNERQQSSFSAEVRAKPQHHKFLIGKNGASIKEIRDQTGARIIFPSSTDEDKEVITIIGKEENVLAAKAQLEAIIKNNGKWCAANSIIISSVCREYHLNTTNRSFFCHRQYH